jgi:microcystin-dependent protein
MVNQYLGEIKLAGYNFAPIQWATCSGQILSIQQNTALFSLLGTTYGGNGTSNFALPNLQSRTICGSQPGFNVIGEETGEESVTILITQYPLHTHAFNVNSTFGLAGQPTNAHYLAATRANAPPPPPPPAPPPPPPAAGPNLYGPPSGMTRLIPAVLAGYAGGSQPHDNLQPYLGMNYCIALAGVFPQRS